MFEKRFVAVAPQLLTTNGTSKGQITVADASLYKVKQVVSLFNTVDGPKQFQVQRVLDINTLLLGPLNSNIVTDRSDVSAYTVGLGSFIVSNEQPRPTVPEEQVERWTYEEEPVVARRSVLVDSLGNKYSNKNLFPVDAEGPAIMSISNLLAMLVQGGTVIPPSTYLVNNENFFIFDNEGNLIKAQ